MTKGRSSSQVTVEPVRGVCDGCGLKLEPGEWGYCSLSCALKHDPRFGVVPITIELPWPPASLSGHNTGHWRKKSAIVAKHREWAKHATFAAWGPMPYLGDGDVRLSVTFYPPDRRGDRTNYPNRMKPYFDGIADALKVNDRRFFPSYYFAEPVSNARVVVSIG